MRFIPGQQIACIVPKNGWRETTTDKPVNGPDMHEVVTANGYADREHVHLYEYPHPEGWEECCFVPLVSDTVLLEELESTPETIHAMRRSRDKHDLNADPFTVKEKSDKLKDDNKARMKKRAKGTGRINRSFHLKQSDL